MEKEHWNLHGTFAKIKRRWEVNRVADNAIVLQKPKKRYDLIPPTQNTLDQRANAAAGKINN